MPDVCWVKCEVCRSEFPFGLKGNESLPVLDTIRLLHPEVDPCDTEESSVPEGTGTFIAVTATVNGGKNECPQKVVPMHPRDLSSHSNH